MWLQRQVVSVTVRTAANASCPHYFGQIIDADGTVLLCLHQWGHEYPITDQPGSLFRQWTATASSVSMISRRVTSARALATRFEEEPGHEPEHRNHEFSLRDLTGTSS
jgi:hypothetical protein